MKRYRKHSGPPKLTTHPAKDAARPGLTVFFTGLSGSGKSTLANLLMSKLSGRGQTMRLLDGDIVRKHSSSDLGFSREDRDANVLRVGLLASEIMDSGGVAICALIAPFDRTRKEVRAMIAPLGRFVLVHVATPLTVCEERDPKGLYAKARAGFIHDFTGVSSPYEPPEDAEVLVDTTDTTPEEATQDILQHLQREGYITTNTGARDNPRASLNPTAAYETGR